MILLEFATSLLFVFAAFVLIFFFFLGRSIRASLICVFIWCHLELFLHCG